MDDEKKDKIYKLVQAFLAYSPLIVWGSGATIPFGLPSMFQLNEEIGKQISGFDIDNDNLEKELSQEKYEQGMEEIKQVIWDTINQRDKEALQKLLNRSHEFNGLQLLIKTITDTHPKIANIITTNYDRVLEYVMSYEDIAYTDGFNGQMLSNFKEANFKDKNLVNLIKVHGSLNWFEINGTTRYLDCCQVDKKPQIITPSNNKYQEAYRSPYRELIQKSDDCITKAGGFLIVGFGFSDEHLTPRIITQINHGTPIVLITKQITKNSHKELKRAEKFVLFEESRNQDMTKVIYKENKETDKQEIELEGSLWQLNQFMEIIK